MDKLNAREMELLYLAMDYMYNNRQDVLKFFESLGYKQDISLKEVMQLLDKLEPYKPEGME